MRYALCMRADKEKIIKLRLLGKSYSEIQKISGGISKSTLSTWLSNIVLPEASRKILEKRTHQKSIDALLKRNKMQTVLALKRAKETKLKSAAEISKILPANLLLIGLALYWAEGYKRPIIKNGREVTYHSVSLTNSDAELVKIFLRFITEICKVPISKIKANVRIFNHLNEKEIMDYWLKKIGIPKENFTKAYVGISRSSMNKRPFNRLPYGVIQIRINDTQLFHRIMGWIEGLKNQI